jgi:septal ring factor EnvC (AmiA/AmiB activator)
MITQKRRHRRRIVVAVLAVAATSALPALSASAANVSQLQIQLGQTQSQMNSTRSREHTLDSKISELNGQVSTLAGQVSLVRSREQAAAERLAAENDLVQTVRAQTVRQRRRLALLRKILSRARRALSAELVSQYEQPQQSFVTLVPSGLRRRSSELPGLRNRRRSPRQSACWHSRRQIPAPWTTHRHRPMPLQG